MLVDLPDAAGAAHVRPGAVRARAQRPLRAVRRLRASNCYDFNPRAAMLADLHEADPHYTNTARSSSARSRRSSSRSSRRRRRRSPASRTTTGTCALIGARRRLVLRARGSCCGSRAARSRRSTRRPRFTLFYWYGLEGRGATARPAGRPAGVWLALRRRRRCVLAVVWLRRVWRQEAACDAPSAAPVVGAAASRSVAAHAAACAGRHRGHVRARRRADRRRARARACSRSPRATGSRSSRAAGWASAAPTPSRSSRASSTCRPSATTSARRSSASASPERNRMACCARVSGPVTISLKPDSTPARAPRSRFPFDRCVERVVVLGNGIAGVTAADHVRRRHPRLRDRRRRRRAAPALQPHGHRAADLRPLGDGRASTCCPDEWYGEHAASRVAQHPRRGRSTGAAQRSSSGRASRCPTTG